MDKTIIFDFPNIYNPNREDNYMYNAYSKVAKEKEYFCGITRDYNVINNPPDVFVAYKPRSYRKKFLETLKENNTKMIYIYPDVRNKQDSGVVDIAKYFDYFLTVTNFKEFSELLPNALVYHFKQGVNPSLYDLNKHFSLQSVRRNWTFIGSYYPGRENVYSAFERQKSKGLIFGNQWNHSPYDVPWSGNDVYNLSFAHVLHKSIVSVNASYNTEILNAWSSRVYKILASGTPMLSDNVKGMKKYFKEGVHCFYYDNEQELSDMISDPINSFGKEQLEEVALKGQKLVRSKHTYDLRGEELMEICNL